ncbi:hypothetical protein V5799_021648 [Amblyomma americanum]|uniref:Uncharacterized protein n=1 Tax=Amblyomma americanum TaxID=6943 RepID=A0AAQ4FMQ1_AMBAM
MAKKRLKVTAVSVQAFVWCVAPSTTDIKGVNLVPVSPREPLSLLRVGGHQDIMNALYLVGFAFVIGMMSCEGKHIADSPVAERSTAPCMIDCTRWNVCRMFDKCECYNRGDVSKRCITKEQAKSWGAEWEP